MSKKSYIVYDPSLIYDIIDAENEIGAKSYPGQVIKFLQSIDINTMYGLAGYIGSMVPDTIKDDSVKVSSFIKASDDIYNKLVSIPGCGDKTAKIIMHMCAKRAGMLAIYEEDNKMFANSIIPDLNLTDIPEKCPVYDDNMCYYAIRCNEKLFFTIEEKAKWSIQRWLVKEGEFYTLKMSKNWYDKDVVSMRIKIFCQFGAKMFKVQKEV